MKIKSIPVLERPRERLINFGVENLSNEELLAIILKTGTKEYSAKELALNILKEVGDIRNLKNINFEKLINFKGIGQAKASELMACIELAKRMNKEILSIKDIKITNPSVVYNYYKEILKDYKQECFYVLYLNPVKKVIKDKLIFKGTVNFSIVHPREVFKEAFLVGATSIICIHNHPSGSVNPSSEDIKLTKQLIDVGIIMGIKVDDHVIIGNNNYYSFYENGNI